MSLAPRLPIPSKSSSLQTSLGKDEYFSEIVSIQKQIPYERAIGKFNPYTSRKIEGPNDYAFYCHCYALCRLYDSNLQAAKNRFDAQSNVLELERQELKNKLTLAESTNAEMLTSNKRLRFITKLICFVSALAVAAILIFPPRQAVPAPTTDYSAPSSSSAQSYGSSPRPDGYVSSHYIGNKNSKKFHRSSCSYLPDKSNQIMFDSRSEAVDSGYSPCGRCNP